MISRIECVLFLMLLFFSPGISRSAAGGGEDTAAALSFNADEMEVDGESWRLREHYGSWYSGSPFGKMLRGSRGGEGEARMRIDIPEGGEYSLWVRYLDISRYRGPFRVEIYQDEELRGERVFDEESLRADGEGRSKWGGGFGQFVWDRMGAELDAGPAQVVMSKVDPIGTTSHARQVDFFAFSADPEYEPHISDFYPPIWVRVRMGEEHPEPSVIHIFGRRPSGRTPDGWFTGHYNIDSDGLGRGHHPRRNKLLDAGEESPWGNIAPLMNYRGDNRVRFYGMVSYNDDLDGSDFKLLFSDEPCEESVFKSISRSGPGGSVVVTINQKERQIKSEMQWSREALGAASEISEQPGRRARRFPLLTGLSLNPGRNVQETVDNETEVLTRLGFSGLSPHPEFIKQGFVRPRTSSFYFHQREEGCFNRPQEDRIRSQLTRAAKRLKESGAVDQLTYFNLMDEPSSASLEHLDSCDYCIDGFRDFVNGRKGMEPGYFGLESREEILPDIDKDNPQLYYWTVRYRHQVLSNYFKLGTDILREMIPDINTTANYANELHFRGNLLARGVDWFLIHGEEALTYGWSEDWCNFAPTWQLSGYYVDFLRAACRAKQQDFGMYNIMGGRTPSDIMTKSAGQIGHGVKALNYFNYGPYYAPTSDQQSHRFDLYPALARINHAIGAVEDYIMDGEVPQSKVAMLYSHSTDIWNPDGYSLHGTERQYFWLLLQQLGYPVEIITEDDVIDGALAEYKALLMQGSHMDSDAVDELIEWVRGGGILYLGAGSGLYDRYDRPLDMRERLGMQRGEFEFSQSPGRPRFEMPRLNVLGKIEFGGKESSLEAFCGVHELTAWGDAQVIAEFEDGRPALLSGRVDDGRVIASGFFPGIAYARGGELYRDIRDEEVTYNPPSFPEPYRVLFRKVMEDIPWRPRVSGSDYLVETSLIESEHGLLITLANWSGSTAKELAIELRTDEIQGVPSAVVSSIDTYEYLNGVLRVVMDVEEFDFVIVPNK